MGSFMINENAQYVGTSIATTPAPLWMKLLAIAGVIWILQTLAHTGINLIYFFAYVYGFIKWFIKKCNDRYAFRSKRT